MTQNNDNRLQEFYKDVRQFGAEAARGQDALPKLALRVARAASEGVIGTDKDADGKDDAHRLYDQYLSTQTSPKNAIHHTPDGKKANVSKLRQIIEASIIPGVDFVDVLNRAVIIHRDMREAGQKPLSAYAGYVNLARMQKASQTTLTDDEIRSGLEKPGPKEKTLEGEWDGIFKKMEKLITGEIDGVQADQHELALAAYEAVKQRVTALAMMRQHQELLDKAKALGVQVVIPAAPEQAAA